MTKLAVPVSYLEGFVPEPAVAFSELWQDLAWERRGSTPRREYYANDAGDRFIDGSPKNSITAVPVSGVDIRLK